MEVIIYTHPDALESIKPVWQNWQTQPNNDYEQFLLVCRIRSEVHYPWVMVAYEDGFPCALLAGRVETVDTIPKLGYCKPFNLNMKTLTLVYQGFLGRQSESVAQLFIASLQDWLKHVDVKVVQFSGLDKDSALSKALQTVSFWQCEKGMHSQLHWQGRFPSKEYHLLRCMKSKRRSAILSRERAFHAEFSGRLSWQWLTTFTDIPALCHDLETLAARTYQRGLGVGFRDDVEHRLRYGLYADRGLLRVALLKLDDELIGFVVGIRYQDALYGTELGYDRLYKDYSPGIILIFWMLERLREEGIYHIDWGLGDAPYKRQFGYQSWLEQSFLLFKPDSQTLMLRMIYKGIILLDRSARFVLAKMRLTNRVKSLWRKSLATSP